MKRFLNPHDDSNVLSSNKTHAQVLCNFLKTIFSGFWLNLTDSVQTGHVERERGDRGVTCNTEPLARSQTVGVAIM